MCSNKYSLSQRGLDFGIRWISREHAGRTDEVSRFFDLPYHTDPGQLSAALLTNNAFL